MTAVWTAGAVTLYFLLTAGLGNSRSAGRAVFNILFAFGIGRVLTHGFQLTTDLFSEERRNGTLGLIVLTGLKPMEIFASKLLGAVLLCAYGLLGALPFFALPFLVGGVTSAQFTGALVFLGNALLFCIALGLLASVMNREGGMAHATALVFAVALTAGTPLIYWLGAQLHGGGATSVRWLLFSPAFGSWLVWSGLPPSATKPFLANSAITFGYSVVALALAATWLKRTWRDDAARSAEQARPGRDRFWQQLLRGTPRWRGRLRRRWLDLNPFCWLAARHRLPTMMARVCIGLVVLGWLIGALLFGREWFTPTKALLFSTVLHQGLNGILAYAAARSLGEERSSGGLETLLTTPLGLTRILDGQRRALAVQFSSLLVYTFALETLLFLAVALTTLPDTAAAVACLIMCMAVLFVWAALHLYTAGIAMWIGLWTGRPAFAAFKASAAALSLGLALSGFVLVGASLFSSTASTIIWCVLLAAIFVGLLGGAGRMRVKLEKELRWIAVAPVPARDDPSFKNWDPEKIFPPGRWGELKLDGVERAQWNRN